MGNFNHVVVSHKLCGFQGHVGRHVVMMKELAVVAPKFGSFLSHIFSQVSHSVTVKVRVDRSVRRKKRTVNNALHVGKNNEHALCWTLNLLCLFCSWWLWALSLRQLLLCFWIITINANFIIRYDPRDKSWALVSLLSWLKTHVYAPLLLMICEAMQHMFKFSLKIFWQAP
jgi:hypothetical protein